MLSVVKQKKIFYQCFTRMQTLFFYLIFICFLQLIEEQMGWATNFVDE